MTDEKCIKGGTEYHQKKHRDSLGLKRIRDTYK